jgi:cell division protein FtsN
MTGKQRGNTLLGLVIGALIGLGIALAVAVYITKMPVPFTNKAVPSQSEIDEAETRKNKDWNPNAPLAGKAPARLAPSASGEIAPLATPPARAVEQPNAVAAEPAQPVAKAAPALPLEPAKPMAADPLGDLAKSVARPAAVALPATPVKSPSADPLGDLAKSVARPAAVALPATPVKSPSADPLGDLAKSVARPAAVALPAVPAGPLKPRPADPLGDLARSKAAVPVPLVSDDSDPFNYFVQAGAFRTSEDAEKQRIRLQALGLQPRVSEREQAGRTVFRVRVGPFDKKDEADQMTNRLNGHSIDTALVRVQR